MGATPSCARGARLLLLALGLLLFNCSVDPADAQRGGRRSSPWQTLDGNAPRVIAKGGHSGLFPDSSGAAYVDALNSSLPGTTLWCDVQLTKDGVGICLPDVKLENCTNVAEVYFNQSSSSLLNGVPTTGYFPPDFEFAKLSQVSLTQGVYSRTPIFDGLFPINSVEDVLALPAGPLSIWLNIQHDMFYSQHKLSMRSYVLSLASKSGIDYVSSPEVSFLTSVAARFGRSKTQLVFRFLGADATEPSTNQTYGSLLKNLAFIKTFASGILVPRSYVWPVNAASLYLRPFSTSLVLDAHKAGLRVFAADFGNDIIPAYDYNYDPISEYLNFVDNGVFSVDGILTDSPITASAAIGCFSRISNMGGHEAAGN